jgi:hypothetical protein
MKRRLVTGIAFFALIAGVGAVGAVVGANVVPVGASSTFASDPNHWSCLNGGRLSPKAITCISGDAEPYAKLSKAGIVVRVFNLKRACVKRVLRPSPDPTDPQMQPYYEYVYTFKPFGGC